jgi:ATP/ADP translocase
MAGIDEDRVKAVLPALSLGLLTAAFIIAKTGRDALFFQGKGIFQLPVATLTIATASLPLAILFVKAMKTWGARPARIGILLLAAAVIALSAPFLHPGDSLLLFNIFMFIPSVFGILFASLWLLASDIFEKTPKREAARAFTKIGASSLAGGMAGGFVAKGLAAHLDPRWLMFVGALVVLVVAGLVVTMHRRFPTNIAPKKAGDGKKPGYLAPLSNRYALTLLLISMAGALAGLLIDVQFYIMATGANTGPKGNANFFANFYIMLNFSSLLLQLFATPKIQDRIGIRGGLMVLPFALIGGATIATTAATALSRSILKVTEGGLRSSIHRSIWEQAFIAVDSSERSFVKIAVDGVGARIAEGIGATVLFFWVQRVAPGGVPAGPLDTSWMTWLTLATVIAWLIVTQRLRAQIQKDVGGSQLAPALSKDIDCVRFPDQCPCTTELGKGIA